MAAILQGFIRLIDIVFLHDSTGSQQPYIDATRQKVLDNVAAIERRVKSLHGDVRYRVVAFRDHKEQGDSWVVHDTNPFTQDVVTTLQGQLSALVAYSGGDGPEAQIDALNAVLSSPWRRDTKKIVILITDSPPHGIGEPGDRIPASHPDALTAQGIVNSYKMRDIQLTVLGCNPEIQRYQPSSFLLRQPCHGTRTLPGGKYLELEKPIHDAWPVHCAIVGSVLYSADSLRLTDKWADWIMDESHRGHDAIVNDLHAKLSAAGEECHDVYCSSHDVKYELVPVSRASVDVIVGKSLRLKKLDESADIANAIFG
ncbi:hypothetical protein B0H19DRAFT_1266727 [Mycena capillaripes]|nr:hypothetical protein B0H19DRAFT_1266727 [Mycena capillaripes]